jgi:hypothetical protein
MAARDVRASVSTRHSALGTADTLSSARSTARPAADECVQPFVSHRDAQRMSSLHGMASESTTLQERASVTKGSTRPDALKCPDRTQKNQDGAEAVEPVPQCKKGAAAARGQHEGDSRNKHQRSGERCDPGCPKSYSYGTIVLLNEKDVRSPVSSLAFQSRGREPAFVRQ